MPTPQQVETTGSAEVVTHERLIHIDQHVLVVNKPAGIAVIPGREEGLAEALRGHWQAALQVPLWVVHRIDRETSGLVLFARDAQTHAALCRQFEQQSVRKTYWALAAGVLPANGECHLALHSARKGKMRPALPGEAGSLASHTQFTRLRLWSGTRTISELSVQPRSGRQHQIRVHLRALGAPLFGDSLYGRATLSTADPPPRLALHAWKLHFEHPHDGPLAVHADLPEDLQQWLRAQDVCHSDTA